MLSCRSNVGWKQLPTKPERRNHSMQVSEILQQFKPISLAEMDSVALLKRTDTKFILREADLIELLPELAAHYTCLETNNTKLSHYNSQYFDSPDYYFYKQHHNGNAGRIKVRIRSYVESDLSFLEIKRKDKKGDTIKKRIRTNGFQEMLSNEQLDFLTESKID